jgi:L-cystine uptake protein TcyP (sodium:dicarboxylate symporter family)
LAGLSGGAKAGIVIGVLLGVTIIVGVGIFVAKRFNLSVSTLHSFDNSLYSSRRGQSSGPKASALNVSNDLTKTENDNPFEKH